MTDKFIALLEKLSNAFGPPGYEDDVRKIIKSYMKPLVDNLKIDTFRNVIGVRHGKSEKAILLAAHMDEVGLIITDIDDNGFLRFYPLGGIDARVLYAQRVTIQAKDGVKLSGFIGAKPPHIMTSEEMNKAIPMEQLFIDVGADSKDEVIEMGIGIGNVATFASTFVKLSKNKVMGKALDDRLGVALILQVLEQLEDPSVSVMAVATVQEEVGARGARLAAWQLSPDAALILEGTTAGDVPGVDPYKQSTTQGKGPAITIADRSMITHPKVFRTLTETANKNNIPYQYKRALVGGTDAGVIHLTREGIPSGVVSVPCRYIHSPYAIADTKDINNTIKLVTNFISEINL